MLCIRHNDPNAPSEHQYAVTLSQEFDAGLQIKVLQNMLAENAIDRTGRNREGLRKIDQMVDVDIRVTVEIEPMRRVKSSRPAPQVQIQWTAAVKDLLRYFATKFRPPPAQPNHEEVQIPSKESGGTMAYERQN